MLLYVSLSRPAGINSGQTIKQKIKTKQNSSHSSAEDKD